MRPNRASFIPRDPEDVIRRLDIDAEVYLATDPRGRPTATAFSGARARPDFAEFYETPERRQARVDAYFASVAKSRAFRAEMRDVRKKHRDEFLASLRPGVVLSCSWGWEQTQVDFFQVVRVEKNRVCLAEMSAKSCGATSWASDQVVAGEIVGDPVWRVVQSSSIKMDDTRRLTVWDGRPCHRSWYA